MNKVLPYLLLVFIIPVFFLSCKKDKNNEKPKVAAEKWFFLKVVNEDYDAAGVIVDTQINDSWSVYDYFSLQPDGTFELVENSDKINGTFKIENSVMTLKYIETGVSVTVTAKVVEKSTSRFTFYVEETYPDGKFRTTHYLIKY